MSAPRRKDVVDSSDADENANFRKNGSRKPVAIHAARQMSADPLELNRINCQTKNDNLRLRPTEHGGMQVTDGIPESKQSTYLADQLEEDRREMALLAEILALLDAKIAAVTGGVVSDSQ